MPKNVKKFKNAKNRTAKAVKKIILKDTDQEYAIITKPLGDRRFHVQFLRPTVSSDMYIGSLRGSFRKSNKVIINDIVLVSVRDFQPEKVDILHKYSDTDVQTLSQLGYITLTTEGIETNLDTVEFIREDETENKVDVDTI